MDEGLFNFRIFLLLLVLSTVALLALFPFLGLSSKDPPASSLLHSCFNRYDDDDNTQVVRSDSWYNSSEMAPAHNVSINKGNSKNIHVSAPLLHGGDRKSVTDL